MISATNHTVNLANLSASVSNGIPMIGVPDIAATLGWYRAIGFRELNRFEDDGVVNFGMLAFGKAEIMLRIGRPATDRDVSLWFYTDQVDALYEQFNDMRDEIKFVEEIYDPFYGGRQFSIHDLNGYTLVFLQPGK